MNAVQLLRQMHADTKVRFKIILSATDTAVAGKQWAALQPMLELHEHLEDTYVYTPVAEECGPGTPLGDWPATTPSGNSAFRSWKKRTSSAFHSTIWTQPSCGQKSLCRCAASVR